MKRSTTAGEVCRSANPGRALQKTAALGALVAALCLSASGAVYTSPFSPGSFDDPTLGTINQNGFVDNQSVTVPSGHVITDVILTLTFTDTAGLDFSSPTASTMTGVLTLSQGATTLAFATLNQLTYAGVPGAYTYTVDLATTFNGYDPNNMWTLVLGMPGGSFFENTLVSWDLNITAVPEPVNVALVLFGLCLAGVAVGRRVFVRARQ